MTVPLVSDLSSCTALTITGVSAGTTISPASAASAANPLRLFYTTNPLTVTLSNITFQGFYAEDCHYSSILGGNAPSLTVTANGPVTFDSNSSSYGGAVRTEDAQTFNGTGLITFQNNQAFSGGGGVFCTGTYGDLTFNCPTAFTNNQSAYEGGAINTQIAVDSNGIVMNNTATFTNNTAVIGGAIHSSNGLIISPAGGASVLFSGNSASGANSNGGAIYAENGLTASGSVIFSGNTALSDGATGGAIYSFGDVNLTGTLFNTVIHYPQPNTFVSNQAKTAGGAVYMAGDNLNYTLISGISINPHSIPAMVGDNDFAGVDTATFNIGGSGQLMLETNNSQWLGHTNINAGNFFIGFSSSTNGAMWGPNTGAAGTITVVDKASLWGYGQIYAKNAKFTAGSTWCLGLDNSSQPPLLNVGNELTLPGRIDFLNLYTTGSLPGPGTYTVATYGSLTGTVNFTDYSNLVFNRFKNSFSNYGLAGMSFTSGSSGGRNQLILTIAFTSSATIQIVGAAGVTTVQPGTIGTLSTPPTLFTSSAATLTQNLSGLTITGFSGAGQAGFINAANTDVTISNAGGTPIIISGNSNAGNGGAISDNTLQLTGPMSFRENKATGTGSKGGAIYSAGNVSLLNVAFTNNQATSGGAVYMNSGTLSYYTLTGLATTVNPYKSISSPAIGDNDFACGSSSCTFNVGSASDTRASYQGSLVLNTNNSGWTGSTNVYEGSFIIGNASANSRAIWGPNSGAGPITISNGAILGGFGTINVSSLDFHGGSSWLLSVGNGKAGSLKVTGQLTLPTTIDTSAMSSTTFPGSGSVTVATYGTLQQTGTSLTALLSSLNTQIASYNLQLSQGTGVINLGVRNHPTPGVWLGSAIQNALVTFEAPGGDITRNGEGLLVRYGLKNNAWGGLTQSQPFFDTTTTPTTDLLLNNHSKTTLSASGLVPNMAHITSWAWAGSVALPVGQTYAWQLWKSNISTGDAKDHGWIAQGFLDLTSASNLSVTYRITPNEGHNPAAILS